MHRPLSRICPAIFILCGILSHAHAQQASAPKADKWEEKISAFEAADKETPPPKDAVLFVGSSSIVRWVTLKEDFFDIAVMNRGFGGSQMSDLNRYVGRIVTPYKPKAIVVYEGDNDLGAGKTPETLLADYKEFVRQVREKLPDTPIHCLAVKPSPKRAALLDAQKQANNLIQEFAATQKNVSFIDVFTPMLNAEGQPRPELYVADRLHMTPEGYAIWVPLVREHLGLKNR